MYNFVGVLHTYRIFNTLINICEFRHVTEELVAQLVPTIMACYRNSATGLSVQSHYLQQLLDVKYAAAILIPAHNKVSIELR